LIDPVEVSELDRSARQDEQTIRSNCSVPRGFAVSGIPMQKGYAPRARICRGTRWHGEGE